MQIAATYARENLNSVGIEAQKDDLGAIYQYGDFLPKTE